MVKYNNNNNNNTAHASHRKDFAAVGRLICRLVVCRLSNTHPRATQEGTTGTRRCGTPRMSPLPAKCSGGPTVPKTNTRTARATAGQRFSTRTGPGTGMEVRHNGLFSENDTGQGSIQMAASSLVFESKVVSSSLLCPSSMK